MRGRNHKRRRAERASRYKKQLRIARESVEMLSPVFVFNSGGARWRVTSGRTSSRAPNVQNIPRYTPAGKAISFSQVYGGVLTVDEMRAAIGLGPIKP